MSLMLLICRNTLSISLMLYVSKIIHNVSNLDLFSLSIPLSPSVCVGGGGVSLAKGFSILLALSRTQPWFC